MFHPVRNLGSFIPVLVLKTEAISVGNKHYLDFVSHTFFTWASNNHAKLKIVMIELANDNQTYKKFITIIYR